MSNEAIACGLSQEEINTLKAKYGELTHVVVERDEKEDLEYLFKKPDMKTIRSWAAQVERDPVAANTVIMKNCCVVGNVEIATNDTDVFQVLSPIMFELGEQYNTRVKKL